MKKLKIHFIHSLYLICLMALMACSKDSSNNSPETPGEQGGAGIEISAIKEHGENLISELFQRNIKANSVWFVEAASGIDMPSVNDHSAFYVLAQIPENLSPLSGLKVAYRANLNGFDSIFYVRANAQDPISEVFSIGKGLAVIRAEISAQETEKLLLELQQKYPDATLELLNSVQIIIFSAPPENFASLYRAIAHSNKIKFTELDREVFQVPFRIERARRIDIDGRTYIRNLDTLRSFTADLCRSTLTSLPAPLGDGPRENPSCPGLESFPAAMSHD